MNTRDFKQIGFPFILTAILMIATFVGVQNISYAQVANPTLTASVKAPLTELSLDGSVVTLTLNGGTYARSISDIRGAVTVSGIAGVTIPRHDLEKKSDTEITVELEFDGNIDADATLTFTVGADAIANYNGPALTARVSVTARSEEYIRGPWLWMIARGSDIESDQLASVSNGDITENHVATQGVNEGDTVGALQWTRGRIPLTPPVCKQTKVGIFTVRSCSTDNINELVNAIGLSQNRDINHHSAYALINIFSPRDQNDVQMGVGSDDAVKVWLNGEIVHKELGGYVRINGVTTWTGRSTIGIQDKFHTNLKAGNNLLLVKVSEFTGEWGMFFEIYLGDKDFTTALPGTTPRQSAPLPDLVVEAVQAEPVTVAPGAEFKLYATLKNSGTQESTATTLRYYRSTDDVISTEDTQLASAKRDPLAANDIIRRYLNVTAPTTPGTYYYGVCVDNVTDESNTDNNCSEAVSVTVTAPPMVTENEDVLTIFWIDFGSDKIQRANLDMANLDVSNVEDLVTGFGDLVTGVRYRSGIALDVVGGKMYWTNTLTWNYTLEKYTNSKIQRANLDGSNVEDLVTEGLGRPYGIALDVAGGKMYWVDDFIGKIQRANLDGSNVEDLVTRTQGLRGPDGIALDVVGGKMYWTESHWNSTLHKYTNSKIRCANLDGSNVKDLVTGLKIPDGIALDVAGGKMYWTDQDTEKIQRANLDGSNVENLVTGLGSPIGIALDVVGGKMYWTNFDSRKIQRANLDGSNIEDIVTGLDRPTGIAIAVSSLVNPTTEEPTIVKEDVNRDGVVDVQDLAYVGLQYGKTGTNAADVNGDKVVDVDDFILVAAAVDSAAAAAPAARAQVHSHFTKAQLQGWLTEARASGNTSRTYQRGIAVVEHLLALFAPVETALLANYPNPFNPETWIPYQLSKSADVRLTIYDIQGHVVRTLALGHQAAGQYQSRSRAAYWDGRNAVGEPVASGLYFYTLTAGDFSATRKMLIRK